MAGFAYYVIQRNDTINDIKWIKTFNLRCIDPIIVQETGSIVNMIHGDKSGIVNVLESHPTLPILATSGKLFLTLSYVIFSLFV